MRSVPRLLSRASRRKGFALLLAAATTATLAALPASAAKGKPDLRIAKVSFSGATASVGDGLSVTYMVKNVGRKRAGASHVRFYLSKDDRLTKTDVRLSGDRRVGRIRAGKLSSGGHDVVVPAEAPTGRFFVIACADARKAVTESKEGNNCAASSAKVRIETGDDGGPGIWPLDPDPVDVDYTVDTTRDVSRRVSPYVQQTITATGEDGTVYTLVIPEGAVTSDLDVTLSPVSDVAGAPLSGGVQAAVELRPHGLVLRRPAILTIETASPAPVAQQTPFLFHEQGADFHLYPPLLPTEEEIAEGDGSVVRMELDHFSTPGIGAGTAADRAALLSSPPQRTAAQYEQAVADVLLEERNAQLLGEEPSSDVAPAIGELGSSYFDDIILAQLEHAAVEPALARQAIVDALAWGRQMMMLGLLDEDDTDNVRWNKVQDMIPLIVRNALDESYRRCVEEHDLAAMVILQSVWTMIGELGIEGSYGDVVAKMDGCLRFEVDFDARFTQEQYYPMTGEGLARDHSAVFDVSGHDVRLGWRGDPQSGGLVWQEFAYRSVGRMLCSGGERVHTTTRYGDPTDGTLSVRLTLDLNAYEVQPGAGEPFSPPGRLSLDAQGVAETYLHEVAGCGANESRQLTEERWQDAHQTFLSAEGLWQGYEVPAGVTGGERLYEGRFVGNNGQAGDRTGQRDTWDVEVSIWHRPNA